jgi:hypothetical protein
MSNGILKMWKVLSKRTAFRNIENCNSLFLKSIKVKTKKRQAPTNRKIRPTSLEYSDITVNKGQKLPFLMFATLLKYMLYSAWKELSKTNNRKTKSEPATISMAL